MIVRDALPDKWCIKTYNNEEGKIIGRWFDKQSKNTAYRENCLGEYYHSYNLQKENIMHDGNLAASFANYSIHEGYTEITFEQFKKYVLKESIEELKIMEKDWSKATEKELLEEAKRRYPIGCKFISFSGDEVVCKEIWHIDYNNRVWIKGSGTYNGICFNNGKWAKITFLPKTKVENKEIIPEYVEYIKSDDVGKIVKVLKWSTASYCKVEFPNGTIKEPFKHLVKPSTKEAFDAQNKHIEKWSVGSYVVFLKDYLQANGYKIGDIQKILYYDNISICFIEGYSNDVTSRRSVADKLAWFATKAEAEEFAKTLVEPIKHDNGIIDAVELKEFPKEGHCKTDSIELRNYLFKRPSSRTTIESKWIEGKSIGVGWNEGGYWVISEKSGKPEYQLSQLQKFFTKDEIKQPVKQAVHCTTQEEWNFVTEKLGNDGENWFKHADWGNNKSFCISFEGKNQSQTLDFYQKANYQILSFQEWCDLNGYKMGNEVKFEIGKWYYGEYPTKWYFKYVEQKRIYVYAYEFISVEGKGYYEKSDLGHLENLKTIREATLEEIQKYLPKGHPDKLYEVTIKNPCSEVFLNHSNGKLDRSNNSIFPTFEEKPLIQMKKLQINKNYFQDFKDPYINK